MKQKIIIGLIILSLLVTLIFVTKLLFTEKANSNRLFENLKATQQTVQEFKTRDGKQATRIIAQELTIAELKKVFPATTSQLQNLYIPPRRVETFTKIKSGLNFEITAPVTTEKTTLPDPEKEITLADTTKKTTIPAAKQDTRLLEYTDQWITISAKLGTDTGTVKIAAIDTIFTSVYRGKRRRPALWIFSRRNYEAAANNTSPYVDAVTIQAGKIK